MKTFEEIFEEEDKEREEWHWSKRNSGDENCDHDMQYSGCAGVIGGICRKCGYKTY